jgi:exodeoxyribonuclease-3
MNNGVKKMKLVSWNVNGLRAVLNKGFMEFFMAKQPDIFCVQETKMQPGQAVIDVEGYEEYWNSAEKKGYSGTAVFSRLKPLTVTFDLIQEEHRLEGRVITLEYDKFFLVNAYTPNSQRELARLDYRMKWQDDFCAHLLSLDEKKPVILCGDLNVAHQEIDLKNPKSNQKNAGFTLQERQKMTELLGAGFIDSFRYKYPDLEGAYTWWSYMFKAREKNVGWRIDYFLVSERIKEQIKAATIYAEVMGSDHCPVGLEIDHI